MAKRKQFYDETMLSYQISYYQNLPEKQRRHFLATEYLKLGRGSQRYLAEVFGCARQIIVDGVKEITAANYEPDYTRQRRPGGGRKKKSG